jgi:hypothetical protein
MITYAFVIPTNTSGSDNAFVISPSIVSAECTKVRFGMLHLDWYNTNVFEFKENLRKAEDSILTWIINLERRERKLFCLCHNVMQKLPPNSQPFFWKISKAESFSLSYTFSRAVGICRARAGRRDQKGLFSQP